jgi:hypothetical protein
MSIHIRFRRPARSGPIALIAALALAALAPTTAGAASSGGWNNLGHGATPTSPPINGKVETLLTVGTNLYVGGDFTNVGGLAAADHIARWDGSRWHAIGAGLGDAASAVYAIAIDGNRVFAGGSFQNAGGDDDADELAVYDGTHWHSLAHATVDSPIDGPVFALSIVGRTLYIGGGFDDANGIAAGDSIVAYNLDTGHWTAMLPASGELSTVASIIPDGSGGLFVGGNFGEAAGVPQADFVAEWNGGTNWSALGSNQAGTDGALKARVRGLARSGGDLYVVGDFTDARGIAAADNIARWDGSHWSALGSSSAFGPGSVLYGVLAVGGTVFVAGYFANAGNNARADSIAAFVNGHWTNVGTNKAGNNGPVGLNATLLTLAASGPRLFVGGLEPAIGGSTMNSYAAWYRMRRPDAILHVAHTCCNVGNDVYSATAAGESATQPVGRGKSWDFEIVLQNDGLVGDTIALKGPGSANGFAVRYLLDYGAGPDITSQVVAGTYRIHLRPGEKLFGLMLHVKVANTVAANTLHGWLVKETSAVAGGLTDAVKAVVKVTN